MKKIFTFFAALLFAGSMMAEEISITVNSGLVYDDYTTEAGWWQIWGETDDYSFNLSNLNEVESAPGTYTAEELDPDYSYIDDGENVIGFTAGSITLAVSAEGVVTIKGSLTGDDENVYKFDLTYVDPTVENTVNVNIPDGIFYDEYASVGLYGMFGQSADGVYVQLAIWEEEELGGSYDEYDLDNQYLGSGVKDGEEFAYIFSADINIVAGEGVYNVTADLLCYNNTLYKVTMIVDAATALDETTLASKLVKTFENGAVVIRKNGVTYSINGQVIR